MLSSDGPALRRNVSDRMVAGVCSGVADYFGASRKWVRLAFVLSSLLGIGIAAYLAGLVVMPGSDGSPAPMARLRLRGWLDYVAVAAIVVGVVRLVEVLASNWAVLLGLGAVAALTMIAVIAIVPTDDALATLPSWLPPGAADVVRVVGGRRALMMRTVAGAVVAFLGLLLLLLGSESWSQLGVVVAEVTLVLVGATLALAPWIKRLGTDLIEERRDRIRSEERAEMAAHLHDSVLQTLALVQRNASDPLEVARLARVQERELRTWLLHGDEAVRSGSFTAVMDDLAAELEQLHTTAVDMVHVRDCEMTDRLAVLCAAAREAIANAQRHAGVAAVSVFTEVDDDAVRVFIRDRGCGFDRDAVPVDRGGLRESIEGRMIRHGGTAEIRTALGEGTEVILTMARGETT